MSITGWKLTLTWKDFQGAVPAHALLDAWTETTYEVVVTPAQSVPFRVASVVIHVQLDRTRTWSRASARSPDLLKHEQGHSDITSLVMRDLDTDLTALMQQGQTYPTLPDLTNAVASLQESAVSLAERLQSTPTADGVYDQQTLHSTATAVPKLWDAAFASARTSGTKLVDCLRNQVIALR